MQDKWSQIESNIRGMYFHCRTHVSQRCQVQGVYKHLAVAGGSECPWKIVAGDGAADQGPPFTLKKAPLTSLPRAEGVRAIQMKCP